MKKILITLYLVLCPFLIVSAQHEKFGKITTAAFEKTFYEKDSSATAIVLYKNRNTHYEYHHSNGWQVVTTIYERIQFFSKDDIRYATKKIPIYDGFDDEEFSIKAYTYNLEGGKIVKTKLDRKDVFVEQVNDNWKTRNFTMPNVKDGSIVEWKYTVYSPYTFSIDDLICQYQIPIVHLRCKVEIPEYFVFNTYPTYYYPLNLKSGRRQKTFSYNSGSGLKNTSIWQNSYEVKKDHVPALISEPYINNLDNYRAMVQFEIMAFNPPNGIDKLYNSSWENVTEKIYDNVKFGKQLKKDKHFIDDVEAVIASSNSQNESILRIFNLVKTKMKWNEKNRLYVGKDGIEKAYKEGVGNSAEINLTLVSMLKSAGIPASPILISTRSHGIPLFPTTKGFNYVIAGIEMNGKVILMDATEKNGSPEVLPMRDLNWQGRLVRTDGTSTFVNLYPNTYSTKQVKLNARLDTEGTVQGTLITSYVGLDALEHRNAIDDLQEDKIISKIESENHDIEIEGFRMNNMDKANNPLVEMIKFNKENSVDIIGNKIYISPLLFLTVKENPFKLNERKYPIDYGSPWKNDTMISLQIPEGYEVESKPQDIALTLPDQMGTYVLKTTLKNNRIMVTSQTKFNTPIIGENHYQTVKEMYKTAIESQMEKIILVQQGT